MSLAQGTRLGHYEIRELIGKGGMGEVYRGYDTQLKRGVVLKVLPEQFSRDSELSGKMWTLERRVYPARILWTKSWQDLPSDCQESRETNS